MQCGADTLIERNQGTMEMIVALLRLALMTVREREEDVGTELVTAGEGRRGRGKMTQG